MWPEWLKEGLTEKNLITFSECIQKFAKLLIHHPESIMDQRRDVRNSLLIYQSFEILPFVLN